MTAFTAADYAALLARLRVSGDEKYRVFNESLMPGTANTYGVRAPVLRAIARDLLSRDWRGFLDAARDDTHEEILLQGLVVAGAPCELPEKLVLLRAFIPKIHNWAVCDMTAASCKWRASDLSAVWDLLEPDLTAPEEFRVRFAAVLLLDYFWDDAWIDRALAAYRRVTHSGYYVTMALAWGLSVFFVKQREKTLPLLEQRVFSPAVHNKAIQKCRESFRVSEADKAYLQTLKIPRSTQATL